MGEAALRFLIGLGERIQAADILVFRWINLGWAHPTLDTAMGLTTQLGLGWVQLALLALLYTFGGPTGRRTALLCMLAFAVSGLIAQILKEGCERVRPGLVVADYRFLGEQVLYGSFPSGHTTTSFALARVVAAAYRRWAVLLYLVAALVGLSRVYVGAHFPTDVLAGTVIGLFTGQASLSEALVRPGRKHNG